MTTFELLGEPVQRAHRKDARVDGLGGREPFRVLPRGEIDALEQLRRQDDLRASACAPRARSLRSWRCWPVMSDRRTPGWPRR